MRYRNRKSQSCPALTILEIIIALAIITIIFAAVLPQFRVIYNSWDSRQANTEVLQNGRVLIDHISRNLSKAVKITAVSDSNQTNGYIQFIADVNDSNTYRYDIGESNYVEYGPVGSLADLAGPVGSLKFTCYDGNNFTNAITDGNSIRFVDVETTLPNPAVLGQDKTFTASAYLRTNAYNGGLVGCWKLDETSGTTAADSSGKGNNGTLVNMTAPGCWVPGQIGNSLTFDGTNDFVQVANLSNQLGANYTISWWAKPNQIALKENILLGTDSTSHDFEYYQNNANLCVRADAGSSDDITVNTVFTVGQWVHICGVGDANGTRVYINGALAGTTSVKKNTTSNYSLNIGAYPSGANSFNGTIDDVRLYNRALTATEIAQLANILRYWTFNEAKAGTDTTSVAISTPATNTGDLLIAAVATDGSSTPFTASGWTPIDCTAYGTAVTLGAWRKFSAGASEPVSHTFSWTGSQQAYGWMMRFTGHNPTNPINGTPATADQNSATPTSPAVTTTVPNCLILRLGAFDDDEITVDSPGLSGHTPITMDESAASSAGAVTYQGFAEAKVTSDLTSVAVSKPAGTVAGDLLIAAVATDGSTETTIVAPADWTLINRGAYSTAVTLGVWRKLATASEPASYAFTWTGGQQAYGWIMRFTGHDPTTPINVSAAQGGAATNTPPCPSVTTTVANTMIVRIGGFDRAFITVDAPGLSGHTPITMDYSTADVPGHCSGGAGYKQQAAIGASGTANFQFTGTDDDEYRTVTIAIAPATVTGTVAGGAGYIKQSTAGLSSGTPTFSLNSSNEARMLTIAIAPDVNGSYDCCGDYIQP